MMRNVLGTGVIAALLLGCSPDTALTVGENGPVGTPGAEVALTLDKSSYRIGETVRVTLTNNSERPYGYNLCGRGFERLVAGAWVAMPQELRLCTAHLDGLPAGAVRTGSTDLHTDAVPGTYRMVLSLAAHAPGEIGPLIVRSASFTVQ
jgi:hypothetical protein